jgi:fatty-acyl-CoA synthase
MTIAYGLTDASPGITMTPRDAPLRERTETVGTVLPEMDASIVDVVTRREVKPGERGEVRVRGYNVMLGYYDDPEATRAAVDADGWLYTGDEASVDERGVCRITGRIKDLIIRGGENIAPAEVEQCLREHADVADAAVYGVPDARLGERVAAAVRLTPGGDDRPVTDTELIAWCRTRLAPFKAPTEIRFVVELPTTPSGKIQKFKLRQAHAEARTPAPA